MYLSILFMELHSWSCGFPCWRWPTSCVIYLFLTQAIFHVELSYDIFVGSNVLSHKACDLSPILR